MAVITVSRGSFSHGKSIAEKVARKLGYSCVSREILLEASKEFNIPEMKLTNALKESPSIIDRIILYRKDKYIAFIQAAILKYFKKDNVIYHGNAGHFFAKDVPHVARGIGHQDRIGGREQAEIIGAVGGVGAVHEDFFPIGPRPAVAVGTP